MGAEKKSLTDLFKNLDYDKPIKEVSDAVQKICSSYDQSTTTANTVFTFTSANCSLNLQKFVDHIKQKVDILSQIEYAQNYKPLGANKREFVIIEKYFDYYSKHPVTVPKKDPNFIPIIHALSGISLFEITLNVYGYVAAGIKTFSIIADKRRQVLVQYMLSTFDLQKKEPSTAGDSDQPTVNNYNTLMVFESADMHSATDLLAESWSEDTLPWRIRCVLVQESIADQFIEIIRMKLRPLDDVYLNDKEFTDTMQKSVRDAREMGMRIIQSDKFEDEITPTIVHQPTIVIGQNRNYFDGVNRIAPIVVMNIFRTAKEAINLFSLCNGGSVSVWTENISLGYELASTIKSSTVWLNGCGILEPSVPISFQQNDYIYGSDFGILEKYFYSRRTTASLSDKAEKKKIYQILLDLITKLRDNFVQVKVVSKIHYEVTSSPSEIIYTMEKTQSGLTLTYEQPNTKSSIYSKIIISDDIYKSDYDLNKIANILINQRKTIIFPFGVSYAN